MGRLDPDKRVSVPAEALRVAGTGVLKALAPGLKPTWSDLAMLMITVSDNVATILIIDRLGTETIQAWIDKAGLAETRLERRMMDRAAMSAGRGKVRYRDSFRRAAVALAQTRRARETRSVGRLAREIGVSEPTLTKWLRPPAAPVLRPVAITTRSTTERPAGSRPVLITPYGVRVEGFEERSCVIAQADRPAPCRRQMTWALAATDTRRRRSGVWRTVANTGQLWPLTQGLTLCFSQTCVCCPQFLNRVPGVRVTPGPPAFPICV
jgi:hypothetical protein